jgi:acyl carrier protein|tara:strand:+ start:53 stop:292 length:240 start_codon:yes stop_codon:yes gene_type:complete
MINKSEFLANFKDEFLSLEDNNFTEEIKFRDLDSWDSLTGMAIQVMIEDNYNVKLTTENFKRFVTVLDVYNHIVELKLK